MRIFQRKGDTDTSQQSRSVSASVKRKKSKKRSRSVRTGMGSVSTYDACDTFFEQARNVLLHKRSIDSVASSSTVKKENIKRARESLASCAIGCVCYDLAEQNYDEHSIGYRYRGNTRGEGAYVVPEKLMRMVLASFAHILSEQQRRNVLGKMGNILLGRYANLYRTHEFVKLLRVVHDLELQLYPHRSDSPFVDAVVAAVDLLEKVVVEGAAEIPDTQVDMMILSLEAGFLLRAAMQACDVLGERAGLSECEISRCTELKKKVLQCEEWFRSVYVGMHMVITESESGVSVSCADKLLKIGPLQGFVDDDKNGSTEEYSKVVKGMESLLVQVNEIGCECAELLSKLCGNSGVASSRKTGSVDSDVDGVSSSSSSGSTASVGLRLKEFSSHMACDVKKVLCGELDEYYLLSKWTDGEKIQDRNTCSEELFASTVASCAMKYLDTLCERESERVPGNIEIHCVRQAREIFECVSVGGNGERCVSDKMRTGFALMIGIVVANVSSGDVFRMTGGSVVINYRMLALFTSMACSLNPIEMKSCLDKLRSAFGEYGSDVPEEVSDMIGMLIDIKRAAWWRDCEAYEGRCTDDCRIAMIDTLIKLMGYQHFCAQEKSGRTGMVSEASTRLLSDVDWLSLSILLLYESVTMANTALRMQSADNKKSAEKLSRNAFDMCERVFALSETRRRLVAGYCDTSSLAKGTKKMNKDIRKYKEQVGLVLRQFGCEYRVDGSDECADEMVQKVWDCRSEMWNKSKAELMSGSDLDNMLIKYMLSVAYMSAKFASDIVMSGQWKRGAYDMPTLRRIVDVHFRCDKTLSRKTAAANDVTMTVEELSSRIEGGGNQFLVAS